MSALEIYGIFEIFSGINFIPCFFEWKIIYFLWNYCEDETFFGSMLLNMRS